MVIRDALGDAAETLVVAAGELADWTIERDERIFEAEDTVDLSACMLRFSRNEHTARAATVSCWRLLAFPDGKERRV